MSDDIKQLLVSTEKDMQKSIDAMEADFHKLRTGRASSGMVDMLHVDYYGSHTPLKSIASIAVPEAQTIAIRPFDPGTLKMIEKAISESDLKLTPHNDGKVIRLTIPPLTQDRRKELAKLVHRRVEEAKVSVRNARREAMEMMKEFEDEKLVSEDDHKRGKEELEKLTHRYTEKIDEHGKHKEHEIMEI